MRARFVWFALVFACEADAGEEPTNAPPPECSDSPCKATLPQCGCFTDAFTCAVNGTALECVRALEGDPGWNEPCTDRCAPGFICLRARTADRFGICHRFCDGDADCGPGGLCSVPIPLTTGDLKACSRICDPTDSDACPYPQTTCAAAQDEDNRWYTLCAASGAAQQGESCSATALCAAGLTCVDVDGSPRCVAWCHVASADCPDAGACVASETPIVVGDVEFGFCL